eukprot:62582_1
MGNRSPAPVYDTVGELDALHVGVWCIVEIAKYETDTILEYRFRDKRLHETDYYKTSDSWTDLPTFLDDDGILLLILENITKPYNLYYECYATYGIEFTPLHTHTMNVNIESFKIAYNINNIKYYYSFKEHKPYLITLDCVKSVKKKKKKYSIKKHKIIYYNIYKYDILNKKWINLTPHPIEFVSIKYKFTIDNINNKLYILTKKSLYVYDLNINKWNAMIYHNIDINHITIFKCSPKQTSKTIQTHKLNNLAFDKQYPFQFDIALDNILNHTLFFTGKETFGFNENNEIFSELEDLPIIDVIYVPFSQRKYIFLDNQDSSIGIYYVNDDSDDVTEMIHLNFDCDYRLHDEVKCVLIKNKVILIFDSETGIFYLIDIMRNKVMKNKDEPNILYGLNRSVNILYDKIEGNIYFLSEYFGGCRYCDMVRLLDIVPIYYFSDDVVCGYIREAYSNDYLKVPSCVYKIIVEYYKGLSGWEDLC